MLYLLTIESLSKPLGGFGSRIVALAFENGDIDSQELLDQIDDMILDVRDRSDGFSDLSDDGDYYKTFEETDFTKLDV